MKRKVFALLLALGLVAAQPLTAAASSPSGTTGVTSQTAEIVTSTTFSEETPASVVEQIQSYNASSSTSLSDLVSVAAGQSSEQTAALQSALSSATALTGVFDLQSTDGQVKTNVTVTLSVPNLTTSVTNVKVLHYSTVRGIWELLDATVDYDAKTVTCTFPDLSPVIIVANAETESGSGSSGGSSSSSSSSSSGSSAATSPKTGETAEWVTWMGAALVLGAAAVLVKKPRRA